MMKPAGAAILAAVLIQGCSNETTPPDHPPRPEAELMADLGEPHPSAKTVEKNEDVLIGPKEGLQSRTQGRFENVTLGKHGDKETRYFWTIDDRGINVAPSRTPFPTPRGHITHTNISRTARFAGEAWFTARDQVTINAHSGRFGDRAQITDTRYEAAAEYWERLGYKVKVVPLGRR